jgi:hypothetical protein
MTPRPIISDISARPGGGRRRRARPGEAGADDGGNRRNLVLGLQQAAAALGHLDGQPLHDRGRRRDRVAEESVDAGIQRATHDGGVAVDHLDGGARHHRRHRRAEHHVVELEGLRGVILPGAEGRLAGFRRRRLALEFLRDGLLESLGRQPEQAGQETQHDDVARTVGAGALL